MDIRFWKWWTVANVGILAAVVVNYFFDIISFLIQADVTYLSFSILAIGVLVVISLYFNYETVRKGNSNIYWFASDAVLSLGMMGTLIGFLIVLGQAFIGIDPSSIASMTTAITTLATGMSTALVTTLTGLIVSVWIKFQLVIIEN